MEINLENIFAFLFVLKSWPFQNNNFSVLVPSQHCWNPPQLEHPGPFRWGDRQIVPATAKVRITTKQKFAQIFCLIAHFLFSTFILWTFEPHLNIQNDQPEPHPLHLQYQRFLQSVFSTSQSSTSVHVRPSSPSASQSINASRSSWTKLMPGQEYLFEMLTYLEGGHHETIFLPLPREKLNRRIGRASSILNPALSLETTDKRQLKKEKGKTFSFFQREVPCWTGCLGRLDLALSVSLLYLWRGRFCPIHPSLTFWTEWHSSSVSIVGLITCYNIRGAMTAVWCSLNRILLPRAIDLQLLLLGQNSESNVQLWFKMPL